MTMTVVEYNERKAKLERMKARFFELDAAIDAREGQISAEQASAFVFNDIRQPVSDVTAMATQGPEFNKPISSPQFTEKASPLEQHIGTDDFNAVAANLQDKPEQETDTIDGLFAAANAALAKNRTSDTPAASTDVRVTDVLSQVEPPAMRLNVGSEQPLLQSIDESLQAGGAALAESVTMGAITLSQRDQKAIEKSPIAGVVGSLLGEVPGVLGALGGAKLTAVGFKKLLPSLISAWDEGGEIIGRTIINAAAREGLGGAYWSTVKQAVEEIKNPDEHRDWNERLTRLATDVGMFAIPGAVVEGAMAGRAAGKIDDIVPSGETNAPVSETIQPVSETKVATPEPGVGTTPLREQPSPEQLEALQDKFKSLDKVVDDGSGKRFEAGRGRNSGSPDQTGQVGAGDRGIPGESSALTEQHNPRTTEVPADRKGVGQNISEGATAADAGASQGIEIAEPWKPKQYDYAAREVPTASGGVPKVVYGEVLEVSEDGATVTFKPRKGKPETVKASELREPESIPRTRDDIDQILEAAQNQRRLREEGEPFPEAQVDDLVDDATPVGGPEVGTRPIKPFGQRIIESRKAAADEARARMSKRVGDGVKLHDIGGAAMEAAENLKDLAIIGTYHIAKGAVTLAEFSKSFLDEVAQHYKPQYDFVKQHIAEIYERAQGEYHPERMRAAVNEQLQYFKDIAVGHEFRPPKWDEFKRLKQEVREGQTGQKLRGKALKESLAMDELDQFAEEVYKSGGAVMRSKEGQLLPVFSSREQTLSIWKRAMAAAEQRYGKTPKLNAQGESAVTQEARRRFIDEISKLGVAVKLKRSGVRLSPEIKRKGDLSLYIILRNDMGDAAFKEAMASVPKDELARQAKMTELAVSRGLYVPAVRSTGVYVPKEFATYGRFVDASEGVHVGPFGGEIGGTKRIDYLIRELDGKLSETEAATVAGQAGPAERNILWRTHDIVKMKMRWMSDASKTAKRAIRGLSDEQGEVLTDVLEKLSSGDAELSVEGLLRKSEIRDITTDEKVLKAAIGVRKIYDDVLDQMNIMRRERGQKEIPKRALYSPHTPEELSVLDQIMGKTTKESADAKVYDAVVVPNKPWIGFDNPRVLSQQEFPMERNTKRLLERYLNLAARDIFDTSIIQNNKAFIDYLQNLGYPRAAKAIANWTAQSFAGARHPLDDLNGFTKGLSQAMGKYRAGVIRSSFPFNLAWTTGVQTSAVAPMVAIYGPKNATKGLMRWATDTQFRKDALENVYALIIKSDNSGSISHQDFNQGMSRAIKLEKTKFEKFADVGSYPSEKVEQFISGWAAATAYERGLQLGYTGKKMTEYMSEAVAKVAGMFNKEDVAGLARSEVFKTFFPFQSYTFEMANVMRETWGLTGTPRGTGGWNNLKHTLEMIAAASVINAVQSEVTGRRPWDVSSFVPLYNALLDPDNTKRPIGPIQLAVDAYQATKKLPDQMVADSYDVIKMAKDGDFDPLAKYLLRYGTAFSGPSGQGIAGGAQWARMFDGWRANQRGGKFDSGGNMMFPITDTKDQVMSLLFGPYSTEKGKEKAKTFDSGLIEFESPTSTAGKLGQAIVEPIPIVGDVVKFKQPEPGIEIVPDTGERLSSRRRSRPRSRR